VEARDGEREGRSSETTGIIVERSLGGKRGRLHEENQGDGDRNYQKR
jgi:hypothetical protein